MFTLIHKTIPESTIGRQRNILRKESGNTKCHDNWKQKHQIDKHFRHNYDVSTAACKIIANTNIRNFIHKESKGNSLAHLKENHCCFNCISTNHTIAYCRGISSCCSFQGRHHSSIWTEFNRIKRGYPYGWIR